MPNAVTNSSCLSRSGERSRPEARAAALITGMLVLRKGAGRDAAARRVCCLARAVGASRSRALIELLPTCQLWTTVELLDPLSRFLPNSGDAGSAERRFGSAVTPRVKQ